MAFGKYNLIFNIELSPQRVHNIKNVFAQLFNYVYLYFCIFSKFNWSLKYFFRSFKWLITLILQRKYSAISKNELCVDYFTNLSIYFKHKQIILFDKYSTSIPKTEWIGLQWNVNIHSRTIITITIYSMNIRG